MKATSTRMIHGTSNSRRRVMGAIVLALSWGSWRGRQREGGRGREGKEERGPGKRQERKNEEKRTRREKKKRRSLVDGGIRGGVNHHRPFLVVFFLCSGLWNPSIRLNCPGHFPSPNFIFSIATPFSTGCVLLRRAPGWFL